MIQLDREFKVYKQRLPELLNTQAGRFVVIKGDEVTSLHDTYEAALDWAYDHYGLNQFFVKEVTDARPVTHYSRAGHPCGR